MTKQSMKVIMLLLITYICLIATPNTIFAFGDNCTEFDRVGRNYDDKPGGGGKVGGGGDGDGVCPGTLGEQKVTCKVTLKKTEESTKTEENLYDSQGNYIGSALILQDTLLLVSGRFVGIDAFEEYQKKFTVTIEAICREGVMVPVTRSETRYRDAFCHRGDGSQDSDWYLCTEAYEYTWTDYVFGCAECTVSNCACASTAEATLRSLAEGVDPNPSYEAKRQDVNDITEGVDASGNPTISITWNPEYSTRDISAATFTDNCNEASNTVTMTYTYNLTPAWIDPVTGKVKYEGDCGQSGECLTEEDKKTYIKVPEMTINRNGKDIRLGWYFVPLNAKSTDLLKYNLNPNMKKTAVSEAMCLSLINKYSTKTNTDEFWGNFIAFKDSGEPMYPTIQTAEAAKEQVSKDHGCRTGLYVSFKVQNEFYNEVNGNLNGYEFYYRPIDYSNPFPNGMTKDGYWYGVYNKNSNSTEVIKADGNIDSINSQDLDNSFSNISYKTNIDYNEKTIREYNHENGKEDIRIYNSWSEMATNGTSNFVNGSYGVSRNGCQSFYSLGCGPANSNWTQCKITEVCS